MTIQFTLLTNSPFINLPQDVVGAVIAFIAWFLWLGGVFFLIRRWGKYDKPRDSKYWLTFIILLLATPLTSLLFGIRFSAQSGLLPPGLPIDPLGPTLMVFSVLTWFLAAGWLGTTPAVILAAFSGVLLAFWDTHNPFTPLELSLMAALAAWMVNQRYRTRPYRLISHPIAVAVLLSLLYPVLFVASVIFSSHGPLVSRLDFALSLVGSQTLIQSVELLVAGIIVEVVAIGLPDWWGSHEPLIPSPPEKSLRTRFNYVIALSVGILMILLIAADWIVAGGAARRILEERMTEAAQMAARGVPYFLDVGQSQILQLAKDESLYTLPDEDLEFVLIENKLRVPYFDHLFLLDANGNDVASSNGQAFSTTNPQPVELVGITLAVEGLPFQYFTVPPGSGDNAALVSFMAPVFDQNNTVQRVLIGRTDLSQNLFTSPILNSLDSVIGEDGEGMLLDENGVILYHTNPDMIMTEYSGHLPDEAKFFDDKAPDGTRQLIYYQPAEGRPWAIVLSIPARAAQQIALIISAPLLIMILVIALVAVVLLHFGVDSVTRSFENLAIQADNIARGQLNSPIPVKGEDEIAQLARSFEQMRISLQSRLEDLNRLINVSQGVASNLDMSAAVQPILDSALSIGAQSARVVLIPSVVPDIDRDGTSPIVYAKGSSTSRYGYLDEQILEISQKQKRLVLTNLYRTRLVDFPPNSLRPKALIALALRHENQYSGVLWVAIDNEHQFVESEVRFLETIAGQAAIAAANAELYMNAEVGRQRLAAILASSPDPVLVTDQKNRLLLANPAAWRVLGLGVEWDEGQPLEKIIFNNDLLNLLRTADDEKRSVEVALSNKRVYFATASSVLADGDRVGRVCILRDITHFKELDTLKSEFVATVSHDLRSPLTLIRGYAMMLDMVGQLNEQQNSYVQKIVGGVENISRLVNNLLDLGRIEAGVDLQLEMVAVFEVINNVIDDLQLMATHKRIDVKSEYRQETIPLLEADQALLQQALHNLVENAIKYTDHGGKVRVRVDSRQGYMAFVVSDTGIGISPVDQPRFFERFYRGAQKGGKRQSGTGLGLAIVRSIAERHGGKVWVESKLGKGSTFFMIIPLRQEKEPRGPRGRK